MAAGVQQQSVFISPAVVAFAAVLLPVLLLRCYCRCCWLLLLLMLLLFPKQNRGPHAVGQTGQHSVVIDFVPASAAIASPARNVLAKSYCTRTW